MTRTQFRKLLADKNMSVTDAAAVAHKTRRSIFRYLSGENLIDPGVVALIVAAPGLATKRADGGTAAGAAKSRSMKPKARRKT